MIRLFLCEFIPTFPTYMRSVHLHLQQRAKDSSCGSCSPSNENVSYLQRSIRNFVSTKFHIIMHRLASLCKTKYKLLTVKRTVTPRHSSLEEKTRNFCGFSFLSNVVISGYAKFILNKIVSKISSAI